MKKHLLTFVLLVNLPAVLMAQSFSIPNPGYTQWSDLTYNTANVAVPITNTSSNTLDVIVEKTVMNMAPFHSSLFCFGTSCYDTSANASGVISFPGNSTETLLADLNKNGALGISCVTYRIFDTNNPGDFAEVEVCYHVTTTGIAVVPGSNSLSAPQPNPADNIAAVNYNVGGDYTNYKVAIYNILGNKVKEVKLSGKQGILLLPVSELNSGVYFYSLLSGNKVISTNRLVVAHHH